MEPFEFLDRYLSDFKRHLSRETLLELLGILTISWLSIFGVGVAATALTPLVDLLRLGCGMAATLALVLVFRTGFKTHRMLKDDLALAQILSLRVRGLGPGLATVQSLRPRLVTGKPTDFSPALLVAEALRAAHLLAEHAPEDLVSYRRVVRLLAYLGGLVAALAILSAMFPWGMARGLRDLLGLPERLTPSWLAGPPVPVDFLAYDLHATLLFANPDGTVERVALDEGGEVTAPSGSLVEVSGRISSPVTSATIVVTSGSTETKVPVTLLSGSAFRGTFTVNGPGHWHMQARSRAGILEESLRRRVVVAPLAPPAVTVEMPEKIGLKPGESLTIRYSVESSTGISGVDVVYLYPLDPDRPPARTHLQEIQPGTRRQSGEVTFTMPGDVTEPDARVDIVIEAFGRIPVGAANTGRSEVVSAFLDLPRYRLSAVTDCAARVLDGVLDSLESSARGTAKDARPKLAAAARRVALEARPVARSLASALVEAADAMDATDGALERAALVIGKAVERESALIQLSRTTELRVEADRLRQLRGAEALPTIGVSLGRARRLLRLLQAAVRSPETYPETGPERVRVDQLKETFSMADDAVSSVEQALKTGSEKWPEAARLAASAITKVAEAAQQVLERRASVSVQTLVNPEVLNLVRAALNAQREVMDATAQAAFDLKRKVEALVAERAPDTARLAGLVEEATGLLQRVSMDRLDPPDATELARIQEDVKTIRELLEGKDLETARKMARDTVDRAAMLAAELRDQADWMEEERTHDAAYIRTQAARIAKGVAPLKDVLRALVAWERDKDAEIGPAERERMTQLKRAQDKVLAMGNRVADGMRASAPASDMASAALAARRSMEEASRRLAELNPGAAEAHQRQAIQDLLRMRRAIEQGATATDDRTVSHTMGSLPEAGEVRLPKPIASPPPDALLQQVRAHMAEPAAEGFEELVRAYYRALASP